MSGADQPLVSVAVPAYNAVATLDATLDSICGQTWRTLEIIIVDDGSSDETAARAAARAATDPRIVVLRKPNGGVAAARNFGIRESRGAFVAPVDADDLWHPEKIARQMARMRAIGDDCGMVYCQSRRVDEAGLVTGYRGVPGFEGQVFLRALILNFVGNGSAPLFRRAALEQIGGYEPALHACGAQGAEDYLVQCLVACGWTVGCAPGCLVGYRMVSGTMSGDQTRMNVSHLEALDIIVRDCPSAPADVIVAARALYRTRLALAHWSKGRLGVGARAMGAAAVARPALVLEQLLWSLLLTPARTVLRARRGCGNRRCATSHLSRSIPTRLHECPGVGRRARCCAPSPRARRKAAAADPPWAGVICPRAPPKRAAVSMPSEAATPPLVSIIIPAYNAAATLGETLASARAQTWPSLEIIVVDDGSRDQTAEIAAKHAARDPRVTLIRKKNGGVSAARNDAIARSRGAFIAPLDSDDIWHPEKLVRQMRRMAALGPQCGFVYCLSRNIDGESRVISRKGVPGFEGAAFLRFLLVNPVGNGSAPVFRREAVESVGGYDPDPALQSVEDGLLQQLIARRWTVGCVSEALVGYRRADSSLSANAIRHKTAQLAALSVVRRQCPDAPEPLTRAAEAAIRIDLALARMRAADPAGAMHELRSALRVNRPAALSTLFSEGSRAAHAILRRMRKEDEIGPSFYVVAPEEEVGRQPPLRHAALLRTAGTQEEAFFASHPRDEDFAVAE